MEEAYNISTIHYYNDSDDTLHDAWEVAWEVITWTVFSIGLPVISLAIYALYFLIRADHIAPVFVINLLVSNLIQICVMPALKPYTNKGYVLILYNFSTGASVGFMVCVACERYLAIVHPVWYRVHRNIKNSLRVSAILWMIHLMGSFLLVFFATFEGNLILISVNLFLPFPLLVFFLVGTLKALSVSMSVPAVEKKRVIGTLVLVLCIYTVLSLPTIIQYLILAITAREYFWVSVMVLFNPLIDPLLYVFMRKGANDALPAFPSCFARRRSDQEQSQVTTPPMTEAGGGST